MRVGIRWHEKQSMYHKPHDSYSVNLGSNTKLMSVICIITENNLSPSFWSDHFKKAKIVRMSFKDIAQNGAVIPSGASVIFDDYFGNTPTPLLALEQFIEIHGDETKIFHLSPENALSNNNKEGVKSRVFSPKLIKEVQSTMNDRLTNRA